MGRRAANGVAAAPAAGGAGGEEAIPLVPLLGVRKESEAFDDGEDRRSAFYRQQAYQHAKLSQHMPVSPRTGEPVPQPLLTLPNVLTFLRLVLVPIVFLLMYSQAAWAPFAAATLFVTASVTDWLDGYLARKLNFTTAFGAFLDPVADKIMVTTALLLMTSKPPQPLTDGMMAAPVTIIICREITMSALREWAAASGGGAHKAVKVNALGKWKTALQMSSMSVLLYCRDPVWIPHAFQAMHVTVPQVVAAGWLGLWAGAAMAAWSLGTYFSNVWRHFVYPELHAKGQ